MRPAVRPEDVVLTRAEGASRGTAVVEGQRLVITRVWPGWMVRRPNARAALVGGWTGYSGEWGFTHGHRRAMRAIHRAMIRADGAVWGRP